MASSTAVEIGAGCFGGVVQVLVGQPFDTIKVRLQSAPSGTYAGLSDCFKRTVSEEGMLALYKVSTNTSINNDRIGNAQSTGGYCILCLDPIRCA
jgi:hypothetical protein